MVYSKFEFAAEFTVPPEFPEVLKGFAREVLRVQPTNIEDFAVKYFEKCASSGDDVHGDKINTVTLEELETMIRTLFDEYDADGSGFLDPKEFQALLEDFLQKVNFPKDEILRFLGEADMNADGKIEYHEFIPIATQMVQALYGKNKAQDDLEDIDQTAADYLIHGMNREELFKTSTEVFRRMDEDKSGKLSKQEFVTALTSMELGLTRREINAIMIKLYPEDSADISYEEFMPFCFDLLQKMTSMRLLENEMEYDELNKFLVDLFQAKDVEESGMMYIDDIQSLLHHANLGLTRLQIYCIISNAAISEDGLIKYKEFIPKTTKIIKNILSFEFDASDVSVENLRTQLMEVLQKLGNESSIDKFEEKLTESGLLSEQEHSAVMVLALNGRSKIAARDEDMTVNVKDLEGPMMAIIKQTRRLHTS